MPLSLTPDGHLVERDDSEIVLRLAVHGESASGKAWRFSVTGELKDAFYFPKALCSIDGSLGALEQMDERCQRRLVPVCLVTMPRFKAQEKGLAPWPR